MNNSHNQPIMADESSKVTSGLTHECGVFGVILSNNYLTSNSAASNGNELNVAQLILFGLEALQHRGQESAGVVTSDGTNNFNYQKGMGLVRQIFNKDNIQKLKGHLGIGHTRYSTSAASERVNCQPFVVHSIHGSLAIAHNGELVNGAGLRKQVLSRGVGLSTHSDSELITQALCLMPPDSLETDGPDWPARIRHLMRLTPLSYSALVMIKDRMYAIRDPYGNRPLCLGKILEPNNPDIIEGWVISSESCAFLSNVEYDREILPGEIVELTSTHGARQVDLISLPDSKKYAFCIFEYVYFARPNSRFEGQEVYAVRLRCGEQLALEHPVEADVVGSVPESGNAAAHGYSRQSGIPFGELLTKNTYVGRTFIQPCNRSRQQNVALKFSPVSSNTNGKRVILIDDSIVRGNTIGPIIKLLRKAGAREVHIRVASPPLKYPCYMGINIPTKSELIANTLGDCEELAKQVGADSLRYLSVDGLVTAVEKDIKSKSNKKMGHCTACLTGNYPAGIPEDLDW